MTRRAFIRPISSRRSTGIRIIKCFMLMIAATLLLAFGCSKDEHLPAPAPAKPSPGGSSGPGGMSGEGGEGGEGGMGAIPQPGSGGTLPAGQPAGGTQRVSEDPQTPPVLAEMSGVFYEVYEIAKKPYTGKVVEYHATNVEKSEKVYKDGRLEQFTEWHENAQKSREVIYAADGKITTEKRWNEKGEEINSNKAKARGMQWTFGVTGNKMSIEQYRGLAGDLVRRGFGPPDEENGGVWVYRNMKVLSGTQQMSTVRFTVSGGRVVSVGVEP
jgi:hypothetical protein